MKQLDDKEKFTYTFGLIAITNGPLDLGRQYFEWS